MKNITVVAKEKGVEIGRQDVNFPESISEAISMHGEATVYATWAKARVIEIRGGMYTKKVGGTKTVARKTVYENLIANGVAADIAALASGYQPE